MLFRKTTAFFAALLIIFSLPALWAADAQDDYGSIADYLNGIYGADGNAGLTAFPVLNIPMGGRSEGMATAFSAVSDDISFIEVNPAGSSMLEKSEFAFFHNNWIADTKIEGLAYANRFGDFGLAAGVKWLYTPFTEYDAGGTRVSNGYYSEGVLIINASYNFFSGYYFSGLSLGVNLKSAFRIVPDYAHNNGSPVGDSGLSQSAAAVMADIGLLTRFNLFKTYSARERNASAAIVIRNLGPPSLDEALPTVVGAAVSYKPIRPIALAFDFGLPLNLMDISLSETPYFAFGISANITNFLSMRAGLLYRAGSSRVSVGSAVNLNKISIDINYTLDLLTQLQPLNRISLAVRLDLGDGGRKQTAEKVDELYLMGFEAYSLGNYTNARLYWEEALRLDPKYEPARESLDTLNNREGLTNRIEDLYRLDF